jgi:hypothetical protein
MKLSPCLMNRSYLQCVLPDPRELRRIVENCALHEGHSLTAASSTHSAGILMRTTRALQCERSGVALLCGKELDDQNEEETYSRGL